MVRRDDDLRAGSDEYPQALFNAGANVRVEPVERLVKQQQLARQHEGPREQRRT